MTLKLFGYRVVIFKVEKLETLDLSIDTKKAQADAQAIRESETFKAIKAQALKARELRAIKDTEFGQRYIDTIARC